jgi:hypothetical protein
MMWVLLGVLIGMAVGTAMTLLSVLVWTSIKLHQRYDNDSIYERPSYYHRSEN